MTSSLQISYLQILIFRAGQDCFITNLIKRFSTGAQVLDYSITNFLSTDFNRKADHACFSNFKGGQDMIVLLHISFLHILM